MNCKNCFKNIDDEPAVMVGDLRLPTCNECWEGRREKYLAS